ncbi:MAG: polyamine aminopropyltransferase [Thermacetogeniaceae bacterium]
MENNVENAEIWFTELQKPGMKISCKVLQMLHREQSPFQEIVFLDTVQFGRMLILDGAVQVTLMDEFVYHEMLAHVPLHAHPAPKDVLIIGGGDGGTAREVLRHENVESVTLVEIDRRVVELSRRYLPELACSYDNPKLQVYFEDGVEFVKKKKSSYDIVLVDSPDPIGQAERLFGGEFFSSIFEALRPDGMFVVQTESPFVDKELVSRVYSDVSRLFPIAKVYIGVVPTYPAALWAFTVGSKKYDPEKLQRKPVFEDVLRYYNAELHEAAFKLPNFVKRLLR